MSAQELRASIGLSGIFGLRMLGMFVILPVFAIYAESLPGGDDLALVGIAIGAYGLTQALLQIPFGWWSDRYGRKPVIYAGLLVFAAGSFVAAIGHHIYVVIVGRVLQGAGAIAAPVMAMAADLTREEHRTKVMAMIGSTIGATFAFSLVAGPWLDRLVGVPGIFVATGVLALAAIAVVRYVVPVASADPPRQEEPSAGLGNFSRVFADAQLLRVYFGILVLHAVLMSLFIAVPLRLRDAGMDVSHHWQVYLPVMLGSFVLMLPAIVKAKTALQVKTVFVGSVGVLLAGQLALLWSTGSVWALALMLLVFFTPFNVLEACLPSLVTRLAPPDAKGTAIGVFSSLQFLGTFLGAAAGGALYGRWQEAGVVALNAALLGLWFVLALGMRVPAMLSTRVYTLPGLDRDEAIVLSGQLQALPGVHEVRVAADERRAYLRVDSAAFDEENVAKLIAGES
jgi:MFS family permease